MTDRQIDIERELCRVAAMLEYLNPDEAPIFVVATLQGPRAQEGYIVAPLVDYGGHVRLGGPVLRQAHELIWLLGLRARFFEGEPLTETVCGRSDILSAHEKLETLALFAGCRG